MGPSTSITSVCGSTNIRPLRRAAARRAGFATLDQTVETPSGRVATRLYNPDDDAATLIFVHGGGWVMGGIRSHDHIARWLAAETGVRVLQIDYSLAPEHPYPAALNEIAACSPPLLPRTGLIRSWSRAIPRAPISPPRPFSGSRKDERRQIAGFVSIYGAYAPEMNLSSHRLYGDGRFGLSEAQMRWFWNLYAPQLPAEVRAKKLSPLSAELSDFPPTLCIGAECDLLLDDTLAFYGELTKAGVDVSLSLWPSLPHGCMHFVGAVGSVTEAAGSIVQFVNARGQGAAAHSRPSRASHLSRPERLRRNHRGRSGARCARAGRRRAVVHDQPLPASWLARPSAGRRHHQGRSRGRIALAQGRERERVLRRLESAYREAIRTLAAKGIVTAQPKVGTKVAPRSAWHILDPDVLAWHFELAPGEAFIRNLFELRKIVEPSAAALAAMRRNDEELSRLADALSRMARANPRTGAWLNAIVAFHHELMSAGRNEALSSLWPAIQTTLRWSIKLQMMLPTLTPGARSGRRPRARFRKGRVSERRGGFDRDGAPHRSSPRRHAVEHAAGQRAPAGLN